MGTNGKRISEFLALTDAAVEKARGVDAVDEVVDEPEEQTN